MSAQVVFCGEVLKANRTVSTVVLDAECTLESMDPVAALRQIAYYKDRAREDSRRVMAYRNAADIVESPDRRRSARSTARPTAGSRCPASGRRPRR